MLQSSTTNKKQNYFYSMNLSIPVKLFQWVAFNKHYRFDKIFISNDFHRQVIMPTNKERKENGKNSNKIEMKR